VVSDKRVNMLNCLSRRDWGWKRGDKTDLLKVVQPVLLYGLNAWEQWLSETGWKKFERV